MDLFVQISRDQNGRLEGTVATRESGAPRSFSSTLELLKILEDVVIPVAQGENEFRRGHPGPPGTAGRQP
jgi:hypothetical protein